jgi:hypothetical protein
MNMSKNNSNKFVTVVESLAETIQNREKIIIQLREENERLQRVAADAVSKATAWKNEVEARGGRRPAGGENENKCPF